MAKLKPVPGLAAEVPPVKKKSSMLLFIAIAALILAGTGGGIWYWTQQHSAEPKAMEKKAPVFVTLEPFTVNLQQEAGEHYLQVGIVFQVEGDKTVDAMKVFMPVIRNRILLLLSAKHPSELAQVEGKKALVAELVQVARESLPPTAATEQVIDGALLSSFVIQ